MDKAIQDLPGFAKWINIAVNNWNNSNINQNQRRQIESWFKKNDTYLFELCDVHSQKAKKKIVRTALGICRKNGVKTLLDYGGGIGEEVILAAKSGIQATLADLPSLTFEFAKWRSKYHKQKINFIEISNNTPLKNSYDAIFCFEVLQHIYSPKKVAGHLVSHLNPNGLLIVTTRFNNLTYPIALRKNSKIEEGMVSFFQENGLELIGKIYQYGKTPSEKHLFVFQKKGAI